VDFAARPLQGSDGRWNRLSGYFVHVAKCQCCPSCSCDMEAEGFAVQMTRYPPRFTAIGTPPSPPSGTEQTEVFRVWLHMCIGPGQGLQLSTLEILRWIFPRDRLRCLDSIGTIVSNMADCL